MEHFFGKHVIDTADFSNDQILELVEVANRLMSLPSEDRLRLARGKILATLFWEPSTRTRLSFETAMYQLGGQVIGFSEAQNSSVSKGETLADTIMTICQYADIIAMRHPLEGAAMAASQYATIPVINGGDGAHLHPTQTLGDIYTLFREKGRLEGLRVGFLGDLLFGRTVHTLARLLNRFNVHLTFFSPEGLNIPTYVRRDLIKNGCDFQEFDHLNRQALAELDVLYVTRIQKERFFSEEEYLRKKNSYIVNPELLTGAKNDITILHPLPRNEEIATSVDTLPNAGYFRQAKCGLIMRMALISSCLGVAP
jgi:aspartate carbamoyltransferase catalytic subunit